MPELNGWLELFLNDQILPPLTVFEPGSPLAADMATLYDHLAQRVADGTGVPLDLIKDTVNDLSTRNGIKASDLLLGKLAPADIANAIAKTTVLNESVDDQTLRERVLVAIGEGINDFGEGFVDGLVALTKLETFENFLELGKNLFLASGGPAGLFNTFAPQAVAEARANLLSIAQATRDELVNEWNTARAEGKELELVIRWSTQGLLGVATGFVGGAVLGRVAQTASGLTRAFGRTTSLVDAGADFADVAATVRRLDPARADDIIAALERTQNGGEVPAELLAKLDEEKLDEIATILAQNKTIGDAARDRIAVRFPGSRIEVRIETPDNGNFRKIDVLTPEGLEIESKVGRRSLTPEIRLQVLKDVELRDKPGSDVDSLRWEFSRSPITDEVGPNAELENFLRGHNIEIVINE